MIRTYITTVSLQYEEDLKKVLYQPQDFKLEKNVETRFPIIPIIANEMKEGGEEKVIAIMPKSADTPQNFVRFLEELETLGISKEQVVVVESEEVVGLKLLLEIIDEIPEDSVVSADITFGTKLISAIVLYAMNLIEKMKDSEVQGIYYGNLPRANKQPLYEKAGIYNITSFKILTDMVENLNALEISNPREAIKKILDI